MKIKLLQTALLSSLLTTYSHSSIDVYLTTFGAAAGHPSAHFVDPDSLAPGDTQGLWQVYDASHISGPSATYLSNLNGSDSPDGDNYWMGQMQGTNNFTAILGDGAIQPEALVDSSGAAVALTHGETYIVHFWMNPFEHVTNDGSGTDPYSTGALLFDISGMAVLSDTASVLASDSSFARAVTYASWTDLAVPFTYDSAWGTDFKVSVGSSVHYGGSISFAPTIISGSTAPSINRLQAVAVDFGTPVPEPSGIMLLASALAGMAVRRRK